MLLSQLVLAWGQEAPYVIQEFTNAPGVYYENIGAMNLYTDIWTLAISMDLTHLAYLESRIEEYLTTFHEKCQAVAGTDSHCGEMLENLVRLSAKVKENVGVLHDLVGAEHPRRRRGLINGLGTIVKAITGNLDAEDGEKIHAEIEAIQGNQETLKKGLKKQIQVVEATLEMFNKTSHKAQKNIFKLHSMIHKIEHQFGEEIRSLASQQSHTESLAILEAYINEFLDEVETLVGLFAQLSTGTVSPAIITPEKLTKYLSDALPHLPRGHTFPRQITRENMPSLLRLSTPKAYRKGEKVILLLEIPLVGATQYSVNNVYPLPTRGGNKTFYYIEVPEELVVVNRESRSYVKISRRDLATCKVDEKNYLCNARYPVIPISESAPCSIRLFDKGGIGQGKQCQKRAMKLTQTLLMNTEKPGVWLYVTPDGEAVSIACGGRATQQATLRGTGILTVTGKCVVTASSFKVETVRRIIQSIDGGNYLPSFNLTLTLNETAALPGIRIDDRLESIVSSPRELNELGERLRNIASDIDGTSTVPTRLYQITRDYGIGAFVIITIITLALVLWCQRKSFRCPINEPPIEIQTVYTEVRQSQAEEREEAKSSNSNRRWRYLGATSEPGRQQQAAAKTAAAAAATANKKNEKISRDAYV